jgi:hypothetical protein
MNELLRNSVLKLMSKCVYVHALVLWNTLFLRRVCVLIFWSFSFARGVSVWGADVRRNGWRVARCK